MPVKLTQLDKKLLCALERNARASLQQLARQTGTSKERVHYRLKRLERESVIKGYRAIINTNALGYTSYRLYISLKNVTLELEETIANSLASEPRVGWLVSVEGNYDLNCWLILKRAAELSDILQQLEDEYKQYLEKIWISIFHRVTQYPKRFLIEQDDEGSPFIQPTPHTPLDEKDRALLEALSRNARAPLLTIASQARLSPEQARKRIRRLELAGVILCYSAIINHEVLGRTYYKLLFWLTQATRAKRQQFYELARHEKSLFYTDEMLNGADVELEFLTSGREEIHTIINRFRNTFPEAIARYELQEYLKEYKLVFLPMKKRKED